MKLYISRYKKCINIAISEDKDQVIEYTKGIRKLSNKEFRIETLDIPNKDILNYTDRPEFISIKYGLIRTNIDWFIMEKDFEHYVDDLITTRDTLKETSFTLHKLLSREGEDSIDRSIEEINNILRKIDKKGEDRTEIEYQYYKRHELNYMNILVYFSYTNIYEKYYKL